MPRQPCYVPLSFAAPFILDADLLAFRGRSALAWLIQTAGRGEYSHVAKAVRWGGDWYCCECREWKDARAVTLQGQVDRYPGMIDVYRANAYNRWPAYDRQEAARYIRRLAGSDYGRANVLAASLAHIPIARCFYRPSTDDELVSRRPPFCSQAVVMADRIGGGVDPVPHLADQWTEPSDLVRSSFYGDGYLCTLVPEGRRWQPEEDVDRAMHARRCELNAETVDGQGRRV